MLVILECPKKVYIVEPNTGLNSDALDFWSDPIDGVSRLSGEKNTSKELQYTAQMVSVPK